MQPGGRLRVLGKRLLQLVIFLFDFIHLVLKGKLPLDTGKFEHFFDLTQVPLEDVFIHVPEDAGQHQLVQEESKDGGYAEFIGKEVSGSKIEKPEKARDMGWYKITLDKTDLPSSISIMHEFGDYDVVNIN